MVEKNDVRKFIDGIIGDVIVFLKGEKSEEKSQIPLYTKEEKKELYSIKHDLEKYPKNSEEN